MAIVEIFGLAPSTYVRAVRMVCEEKSIPYELKPAAPHSPEICAIHPFGKMPAMRHGDIELCESKAIATYLDATFPGPRLIPSEPLARAREEQWVSLVNTKLDQTLVRTYLFAYIFPKGEGGVPDRKAIDEIAPDVRNQIGILDRALSRSPYLAGNEFTYADINLMPILFYVQKFPEGGAAFAEAVHLSRYYERNAARPSFANTAPPPPPRAAAQ
jgi:glutathione S-transferase